VREVQAPVGIVMREVAGLRAVRPDVDDGERLVGKRGDVGPRPPVGGGRRRECQRVDRDDRENGSDRSA
jgi:hypothetical protein